METIWEPMFIPDFNMERDFDLVLYPCDLQYTSEYGIIVNEVIHKDITKFIGMIIVAMTKDKDIFGKILGFSSKDNGRFFLFEPRIGFYDRVDLFRAKVALSDKKYLESKNLI